MLHQVSKEVLNGKLVRRWDTAQTPYQRLLTSGVLTAEQEARLAKLYAATNPRQLREQIYQAVAQLWQHVTPNATPTRTREEAASPR